MIQCALNGAYGPDDHPGVPVSLRAISLGGLSLNLGVLGVNGTSFALDPRDGGGVVLAATVDFPIIHLM